MFVVGVLDVFVMGVFVTLLKAECNLNFKTNSCHAVNKFRLVYNHQSANSGQRNNLMCWVSHTKHADISCCHNLAFFFC